VAVPQWRSRAVRPTGGAGRFWGYYRETTFDVYGHLLPGSYDDIRARMDAYLAKAA
jgi:hypothetical protein